MVLSSSPPPRNPKNVHLRVLTSEVVKYHRGRRCRRIWLTPTQYEMLTELAVRLLDPTSPVENIPSASLEGMNIRVTVCRLRSAFLKAGIAKQMIVRGLRCSEYRLVPTLRVVIRADFFDLPPGVIDMEIIATLRRLAA
jgi:hypothetical protein